MVIHFLIDDVMPTVLTLKFMSVTAACVECVHRYLSAWAAAGQGSQNTNIYVFDMRVHISSPSIIRILTESVH